MKCAVNMETAIRWIEKNCRVQDATGPGTVPAILTKIQKRILRDSPALSMKRDTSITWKPRQIGSSTAILCLLLYLMIDFPGIAIAWLSKSEEDQKKFRRKWDIIVNSVQNSLGGQFPGIKRDNEESFQLANGSTVVWTFSGDSKPKAESAGRGDTFHLLIATELAFFSNAKVTMDSICPALERAGLPIFIDSTPNEMEGDGEVYYEYAMHAYDGTPGFTLVSVYWWEEDSYRIVQTEEKRAETRRTYTEEEKELVSAFGLCEDQIAWRRNKIAFHKEQFRQIYPENFLDSFSSGSAMIFKPEIIREIAHRVRMGKLKPPMGKDEIKYACKAAGVELYGEDDILLTSRWGEKHIGDGFFRVWRVPSGQVFGGADCSQGTPGGHEDWQSTIWTTEQADICAFLYTKFRCVEVYADAVIRACMLLNSYLTIENEKYGAVLHSIVSRPQDEKYLRSIGLGNALEVPYHKLVSEDGTGLRAMNARTRPIIVKNFISFLNEGFTEVNDEILFSEMCTLVNNKGRIEHRNKCHDDALFSLGHSIETRNMIMLSPGSDADKAKSFLAVSGSSANAFQFDRARAGSRRETGWSGNQPRREDNQTPYSGVKAGGAVEKRSIAAKIGSFLRSAKRP